MEEFRAERHIVLQAGAGGGKTSTLIMMAKAAGRRRGRYIAFNKPIALEAAGKFPHAVECRTAHSMAYQAVGNRYAARLNAPRPMAWKAGEALGISRNMVVHLGERKITNRALSYSVSRTVKRFCFSADDDILPCHVPRLRGVPEEKHHELVSLTLPFAHKAWKDLQNPDRGVVRFDHDHYLKIWALQRPTISGDFLLLDEAQDTNPVLEEIFNRQRGHAQLVMVGDSAQAIYGWRGARDVMSDFDGDELHLSQSFRFGPRLAHEANRWLSIIDSPLRLRGTDSIDTQIGKLTNPDAILCRTNVGAMLEILQLLNQERRVALVGGGKTLADLAQAAIDLKAGRRPSHPDLILFESWGDLQEYALYDPDGGDLLPLVDLVDEHGVEVILDAVARLSHEGDAEVTLSTAHRAKGREWPAVKISTDFEPDEGDETDELGRPLPKELDPDEARLAYVAVTRARHFLDPAGLLWINDHPNGNPNTTTPQPTRKAPGRDIPDTPPPPDASPWDLLGLPPG